ncbi:hypothetical protein L4174_006775 [Photobacterium sp. CCB-ST2H9]|uniref:hypothetical protein n=1 Tax=Photobacterium sp. CCB-ST2H9 TaxID=2912855 RepID=UPI002002C80C|nr:hypothetical protein [Photobacterium sp. CCB-ST2H9]UTM58533.1 hypothetical protein L4174_006775 [Photobacterium sp. CCB-ST2H9]
MKNIICFTFSAILALSIGNYYLWHMEKKTEVPPEQSVEENYPGRGFVEDGYTVDKLNSQISVKQLRKLVLQDEQAMLQEQASTPQENDNYDLNQLNEEISSLQQYLNKEE